MGLDFRFGGNVFYFDMADKVHGIHRRFPA
jgi:hypothetical protein